MNSLRHTVHISETETEYLLSIHASQKERAKTISGYRWDTTRRCWIYPKTVSTYDALIEEFGNDITSNLAIGRPSSTLQSQAVDLQLENQDLREEIAKIHKTLELISGTAFNNKKTEIQVLQSTLATKESELAEITYRTKDIERQLEEQRFITQQNFKEVQRLRAANKRLQTELDQQDSRVDRQQWIREIAKATTGGNEKFCLIVDRLRFNATLPIELVKELESELRRVLNCNDRNANIHDLLTQASDASVLTTRGIDLAHIVRKQRNVVAHEATDGQTLQVRILLCLFAAALLWKEFAEHL